MSILIKNGYVVDMLNKSEELVKKDIYIEGSEIKQIGVNLSVQADKVIEADGKVVMPGLINCHNHAAMSIFRGYADDLELMDWLYTKIFPIEDKMSDEDIYYAAKLSMIEMIKSGTTTVNDMYFGFANTIKAATDCGIRGVIGCALADSPELEKRIESFKELHEKCINDKLQIVLAPHAPYTCSPDTLKRCVEVSQETKTPIHIHLSETLDEQEKIKKDYNLTPTEYLYNNNVFDVRTILAHGVYLSDSDLEILKGVNTGISHNPISNLKLASGIAPIVDYKKEGLKVGIGTDGAGSTNTLDMFEEMRACAYSLKVKYMKSSVINSYDILKMATVGGSEVLNKEDEIGILEEGKKADIIIIDINKPHLQPISNIYSTLVYSATGQDVETTIIDGEILMEKRELTNIDETECIKKCSEITKRLGM